MELGTQGLLISRRAEVLLNKFYPTFRNYPKSEKFRLCAEMKEHFYKLIANAELANSVPSLRKRYAQTADGHLQILKVLVRLSVNQKYISKGFYKDLAVELDELNKILSGYIKSAR